MEIYIVIEIPDSDRGPIQTLGRVVGVYDKKENAEYLGKIIKESYGYCRIEIQQMEINSPILKKGNRFIRVFFDTNKKNNYGGNTSVMYNNMQVIPSYSSIVHSFTNKIYKKEVSIEGCITGLMFMWAKSLDDALNIFIKELGKVNIKYLEPLPNIDSINFDASKF